MGFRGLSAKSQLPKVCRFPSFPKCISCFKSPGEKGWILGSLTPGCEHFLQSLRAQKSCCTVIPARNVQKEEQQTVEVVSLLSCCSFGEVGVFYFPALPLCSRTNLPPSSAQVSVPTCFKFAAGIRIPRKGIIYLGTQCHLLTLIPQIRRKKSQNQLLTGD